MGLIVPLISAALAYSTTDRPCFAPGFIVGFICGQIQTGFIGGIFGDFLVGYTVLLLRRVIKLPASMQGFMPVMILPVLSTIIAGLLMMTFIGQPIVWLQKALIHLLESMQKRIAFPYARAEKEALKAAFPMGICMITEGVIPIAARDLLRVVASAIAGGLIMVWGVVPLFTRPAMFCLALGIGTVIYGVMLSRLKKRVTETDEEFDDVEDRTVRAEDIKFILE